MEREGYSGTNLGITSHFPSWPPDLFAATTLIAEQSGVYSFWNPSSSDMQELANTAALIGRHWRNNYLSPTLQTDVNECVKYADEHYNGADKHSQDPEEWFNLFTEKATKVTENNTLSPELGSLDDAEKEAIYTTHVESLKSYFFIEKWWKDLTTNSQGKKWLSGTNALDDTSNNSWFTSLIQLLIVADEASKNIVNFNHQSKFNEWSWVTRHCFLTLYNEDKRSKFLSSTAYSTLARDNIPPERQKGAFVGSFDTLSLMVPTTYCTILPKSRTPQVGATLRSLSRFLSHLPGSQEVVTTAFVPPPKNFGEDDVKKDNAKESNGGTFNLLAVPYPYNIPACSIQGVEQLHTRGENSEKDGWGKFKINSKWLDQDFSESSEFADFVDFLMSLVATAETRINGKINGIVLPEGSISFSIYQDIVERIFKDPKNEIELLIAGTTKENDLVSDNLLGLTYFSPHPQGKRKTSFYQPKHHRWRLDRAQILNYGLVNELHGHEYWWENISTDLRYVQFIPFRKGNIAALICEDLARIDPCQTVLRAVGPSLVIALLMDGPQMKTRWSARYATILSEDPGSSVLSLTSLGLIRRTEEFGGFPRSNCIALWQDPVVGAKEIELKEDHHAVIMTIEEVERKELTLDDRTIEEVSTFYTLSQTQSIKLQKKETSKSKKEVSQTE